jgi:catalase
MVKKTLTTDQGVLVADNQYSLTSDQRGPVLLEDVDPIEKLAHFGRERIPERVVHARSASAHGYFQVSKSMADYTKVKFLQDTGKKTQVLQQTAVSEGLPAGNTVTISAPEATVSQVGIGIFKASPWIKSYNETR